MLTKEKYMTSSLPGSVSKIGPNHDQSSVKESIGIPGYLDTGVAPTYGTADANGYVGVSADYNSHANQTDRPTGTSAKAEDPEEGDTEFGLDHDGPQLGDADGKPLDEDNLADNERSTDSADAELEDGESVNHLGKVVKATKPAVKKAPAKKAAPRRPVGGKNDDDNE